MTNCAMLLLKQRLIRVFGLETVRLSSIQYSDSVSLIYIIHEVSWVSSEILTRDKM
jgi:hypothetical protein